MIKSMLEKYLQEIGLTDKEAAVYLELLATDNSSVVKLAEKTKIKRPTVYVVLETLAKKGLVSETTVGKKTNYQAEPPERLETFVERQKVVLDERSKRLKDIIPQVKSVQREGGERPVVRYFEGREGIVSANADVYRDEPDQNPMHLIYSKDLLDDLFTKEESDQFRQLRLNKKIPAKVIYTYTKGELGSGEMSDRVRIDEKKYPIECDIAIYKDRVRIGIIGKSLSGIFVQSKEFANTLRSLSNIIHDLFKEKMNP